MAFAVAIALATFGDRPLVEIPMATSLGHAKAAIWRENIWSKPQSFPTAVTHDEFTLRAKAGNGGAVKGKPPHELRRDVLSVRGAPTVPK